MHEYTTVNYNEEGMPDGAPTYLFDQAELYRENPLEAGLEWFKSAQFGLCFYFGLHSLLGKGEAALGNGMVSQEQYNALPEQFKCEHFDAIDIIELAVSAGARYIRFPACTEDGFCLFSSEVSDFNTVKSTVQRDLVGELASTCEYHGLGLILEYNCGVNRNRYPDGITDAAGHADFVRDQIHELLTQYGPIAGICFTGAEELKAQLPDFDIQDCYNQVHALQPQCLVAFGSGVNGKEDLITVENSAALPEKPAKPQEILAAMSPSFRSYDPNTAGKHKKAPALWEELRVARTKASNLLVNTALMPDGSLDLEDINTLIEVGQRVEQEGWPKV